MSDVTYKYISSFSLKDMWGGKAEVTWTSLNKDVNILVGINGAGKTTFLNAIYAYYSGDGLKKQDGSAEGSLLDKDVSVSYIRSFDVPSAVKRSSRSPLMEQLENLVIKNKNAYSFFDYRMRALNFPQEAKRVNERIEQFITLVNKFFVETNKAMEIDKLENSLVFVDLGNNSQKIRLEQLSAGEADF